MHLDIWECGRNHIHLNCEGFAIQFQDFDEFMKAISLCQEYIEYRRRYHARVPDAFSDALNQLDWPF